MVDAELRVRPGVVRRGHWFARALLSLLVPGLGACGAAPPAGPSPSGSVPAGSPVSCGRVVVGGPASTPMTASMAGCLVTAWRGCRSARLVVVEQGVDALRTDTLTVVPQGGGCAVSVSESVRVVPRPATTTTVLCRRVAAMSGVLVLDGCGDGRPRTVPSGVA